MNDDDIKVFHTRDYAPDALRKWAEATEARNTRATLRNTYCRLTHEAHMLTDRRAVAVIQEAFKDRHQ